MNSSFPYAAFMKAALKCRLFDGLPTEVVASLAPEYDASVRDYKKGDVVFSPDSFQKGLGLVIRGSATVVKNAAGREIRMSLLQPGSLFGMACLYSDAGRFASEIRANNSCSIVFWEKSGIDRMFADCPSAARNYVCVLTERINHLSTRIDILSCPAPADRLAAYVSTLPTDENSMAEIVPPLSVLSRELNIGRATLYRIIADMKSRGLCVEDKVGGRLLVKKTAR